MQARDDSPATLRTIALPLLASFVVTGWAMVLVCRFELGSTLTVRELFIFPLVSVTITAALHWFVVTVMQRLLDLPASVAARSLALESFAPVAWVPLLIVLATHGSLWTAVLVPGVGALTTAMLLRHGRRSEPARSESDVQSLFRLPARSIYVQTILPALLAAIAAQFGVMAGVLHHELLAGVLLAAACVLPLLRLYGARQSGNSSRARAVFRNSAFALLLMTIAMVPFLKDGPGKGALERLLQMQRVKAAIAASARPHPGAGYSGIVLLPPPKPREAVLPPVPTNSLKSTRGKPLVIPFNGVYWYFKEFDEKPRPDARVVHGDPLKAQIRSTTKLALLMEAHQAILPALKLDCCSAIEVNLTNADTREGIIGLELLLRDTEAKSADPLSLGTLVIPSTTPADIPFDRKPINETLTFRIPRSARDRRCSEITLRMKTAGERSKMASQVSVDSFVLIP